MADIPLEVTGISKSPARVDIKARQFELIVDEPPEHGGEDMGADPVSYFMAGLLGCINVIGHMVAKEMDLEIRGIELKACGTLDPAKAMGQDTQERAGLKGVKVSVKVDAEADEAILAEWLAKVESRCPVADNIRSATPLEVSLEM